MLGFPAKASLMQAVRERQNNENIKYLIFCSRFVYLGVAHQTSLFIPLENMWVSVRPIFWKKRGVLTTMFIVFCLLVLIAGSSVAEEESLLVAYCKQSASRLSYLLQAIFFTYCVIFRRRMAGQTSKYVSNNKNWNDWSE